MERYIPLENPYTYEGTNGPWNEQELHCAFVNARVIEIDLPITDRPSTMFTLSPSDAPVSKFNDFPNIFGSKGKTRNLKITKCGLLNRKDDTSEGGKKNANRKWKSWSVVLTGSQLLFFRDTISTLQTLSTDFSTHPPPTTNLRPDELFSLKDSIAVYDRSYTKVAYVMSNLSIVTDSFLVPARPKICLARWTSASPSSLRQERVE